MTIVVPHGNSTEKNAAMVALGAELVVHGDDYQEAREHAEALSAERGLQMVGPFEPDLVLGVATYARELFDAVPDLDVVYVPVGMGSGICGLMTVRDLLGLRHRDRRRRRRGRAGDAAVVRGRARRCRPSPSTRSSTVSATRVPDPVAIELICAGAPAIVAVPDDDTREAMRVLHRCTHSPAEPAGAIALAGALAERALLAGRQVAVVQSGANADAALVAGVLAG